MSEEELVGRQLITEIKVGKGKGLAECAPQALAAGPILLQQGTPSLPPLCVEPTEEKRGSHSLGVKS